MSISNVRNFLILLPLTLGFFFSSAQKYNNPYSVFGVGLPENPQFVKFSGAPSLAISHRSSSSWTLNNIASLASIEYTIFDAGFFNEVLLLDDGINDFSNNRANFSYFSLAFPIHSGLGWGAAFGLTPQTSSGFYLNNQEVINGTRYTDIFRGDGGLSRFFIGSGIKIREKLYVGLSAGYVFGKLGTVHIRDFERKELINTYESREFSLGGLNAEAGLQFHTTVKGDVIFSFGASARIPSALEVDMERLTLSFDTFNNATNRITVIDTLLDYGLENERLDFPAIAEVGFQFEKKNKWRAGVSASYGMWENMKLFNVSSGLRNSYNISLGGEFIPDHDDINYFKRMSYRFGINYASLMVGTVDPLNEYSMNLGFGFPLRKRKPMRYGKDIIISNDINLGLTAGVMGTEQNDLTEVKFIRINLGITLNDKWFVKQKID